MPRIFLMQRVMQCPLKYVANRTLEEWTLQTIDGCSLSIGHLLIPHEFNIPPMQFLGQNGMFHPLAELPIAEAGERIIEIMPQPVGLNEIIGAVTIVSH